MAKCIVFGGAGFIGSHVVDSLIDQGHYVRVFSRSKGKIENQKKDVEHFYGDFQNDDDVKRALSGCEYVFHFISSTNPSTSENDPLIDIETNVKMTVKLLKACVEEGVKKVVFSSSGGSIYGDVTGMRKESDPTYPISPYAIGKQSIEGYLRYFQKKHGLDYLVLRIANAYGARQYSAKGKHGVIPVFLEKVRSGQPITIYGDGTMTRDYIYVKDLADFVAAIFQTKHKHRLYNIGSGEGESVNGLIEIIERITGRRAIKLYESSPASYIQSIVLDCNLANKEFGKIAPTSLEAGIRETYDEIASRIGEA